MAVSVTEKTSMNQHLRYKDKVTIVTGGSKGIGEGCVRVFVRNGSNVVFCCRNAEEGKLLESELNAGGEPGQAFFVRCDVTNADEIQNLIEKTVEKFGRIDCLINNAGTHPPRKMPDEFTAEEFSDLFNLNVISYFSASKYALPYLRKTEGNIINMSSLVANIGQEGATTYCATKGAIIAMTKAMAVDEARHNVRVNVVSPGNVWTPLWDSEARRLGDGAEAAIQTGKDAQLMGRFGTIQESGELCLFLAAEATFMTGVDIPLSGGAELNYGNKNQTMNKVEK